MKNDSNNRVPANKHYLSRRVGWIVFIFMLGIGGYLALPSNYYLRRALIHLLPKIDQYPIFENRVVKAGSPRPWELSEAYNTKSIPERYLPRFEELGTVAYVIIQDNRLLFEQYWEDYSPESHSNSFSMAKSIVSLAIGCAIDDGFIRNVDQPVSDFFPEFKGYDGKALTLRHLLTMSAGVDFDEAYSSPFSPTTQLYYCDDLQEIAFGMKEIDEPGVNFIYQSGVTQLLGFIVEKATGEKLSDYVSRKLWTPMHAEESALWSLDRKDGMEKAYCCFNSNARDFARFGQLLLNNGQWDDRQLISPAYLAEATSPDTRLVYKDLGKPNHCYGFQYWILDYKGMKIPYMRGIIHEYHDIFTGNIIAQSRMKGVGVLSREDAISFGCTGGTGRASGWACDVRKRIPYGVYDKVDFQEIVYTEGDCFARYLVRMDEIMESLKIIEQLIDNIPEGPYQEKMKPIIRVPEGSYYAAVEGSRGEFGVFLESQGDKMPYRLHYRATGLPLVAAIDTICRGAKIADLIAIGGTLDYVVPDIDR